jgi:phage-related minor tail protein
MATQAEVEAALRKVLNLRENMDIPTGQPNNERVFALLLSLAQTNTNDMKDLLRDMNKLLDLVRPQADDEQKVLAAVGEVKRLVGDTRETVLATLAALKLDLTDEQIQKLADALHLDADEIAEAVRLNLSAALQK